MNIDEILDEMDDVLDKSTTVPFSSHKTLVDAERLRELINDIRLNIPQEIKRAKLIDFDCDMIMKEARTNAEKIVREAEEKAKTMVSNDAIMKEAKQRAIDMLTKAQASSKEMKNAANTYVNNILNKAEKSLTGNIQDIRNTRQQINKIKDGGNDASSIDKKI